MAQVVSIIGRQNVGKSTLFNLLIKEGKAITENIPGVTRDILKGEVKDLEKNKYFTIQDTPGLDVNRAEDLSSIILKKTFSELKNSDLLVYVLDKKELTKYDFKLIDEIRKDPELSKIPIIFCINKVDSQEEDVDLDPYYSLGINEFIPISAKGRRNISVLLTKIKEYIRSEDILKINNIDYSLAIIGKPNAGKSSLLNAITRREESVVSEIAGTTRDFVESVIQFNGKKIKIVDTAGLKKRTKITESLEFYSITRTEKVIQNTDIVIHLIDASKGLEDFDKKIFNLVEKEGKIYVLAINKWDLLEDKDSNTFKEYKEDLTNKLPQLKFHPVISVSVKNQQRIHQLLDICNELSNKKDLQLTTREINQFLSKLSLNITNTQSNKIPKIYYATQVSKRPLKILFFVNHKKHFQSNIITYMKKQMINFFHLEGLNLQIEIREN